MYVKIKEIKSRYHPDIKGILHLGAHLGEEAEEYYEAGYERVIWIEGNPELISELKRNVSRFQQNRVYNLLISDKDDVVITFNVTEFSQSSSVLELGVTKEIHNTRVIERIPLTSQRLDTFFLNQNLDIDQYNFVNVDLQGYELVALRSMGEIIKKVDWIYAEVNIKSLYQGCALLYQMDIFLLKKGFVRVQIYMTTHFWGDALYKRKKIGGKEKFQRIAGIYSEEAVRVATDLIQRCFKNIKRLIKNIIKRIIFTR